MEGSQSRVGNAMPGVPNHDSSAGQASTEQPVPLVAFSGDATVSTATPLPVYAGRVRDGNRIACLGGEPGRPIFY